MILVVDNYDSFTWNLVHYLAELGAETHVVRNDDLTATEAWALQPVPAGLGRLRGPQLGAALRNRRPRRGCREGHTCDLGPLRD